MEIDGWVTQAASGLGATSSSADCSPQVSSTLAAETSMERGQGFTLGVQCN
jgi:hypothetical protein